MPNIIDILARALSLRQETALNSITPNRAGGIMYDTLLVLNQMQLEGGSLLISKVYASVSAMEADTTPTSDLTGRALKPGQLVVIVTSDSSSSDMGSEYRFNGPGSWTYVGKVGGLPLDTVPTQSSTKGITSGGVYAALSAMKAEGYKYMGLATPGSGGTTPGTPNQPVFYIAGPGSYPNFGSITVASGYLGFIKYSGGSWAVESVAVGKDYDEEISQLRQEVTELPFSSANTLEKSGSTTARWQAFLSFPIVSGQVYRITILSCVGQYIYLKDHTFEPGSDSGVLLLNLTTAPAATPKSYLFTASTTETANIVSYSAQAMSVKVERLINTDAFSPSSIDSVPTANSQNLVRSGGVSTAISNLGGQLNTAKNEQNNGETIAYSLSLNEVKSRPGHLDESNKIVTYGTAEHIVFRVNPGDSLYIVPKAIRYCGIAFVKSYNVNASLPYSLDMATGSTVTEVPADGGTYTVPTDAKFIVMRSVGSTGQYANQDVLPKKFVINEILDLSQTLAGNLSSIKTDVKQSVKESLWDITDNEYEGEKVEPINKAKYLDATKLVNGVSTECSSDGSFSFSGTATSGGGRGTKLSQVFVLPAGTYELVAERLRDGFLPSIYLMDNSTTTSVDNFDSSQVRFKTLTEETSCYIGVNVLADTEYGGAVRLSVIRREAKDVSRTAYDGLARTEVENVKAFVPISDYSVPSRIGSWWDDVLPGKIAQINSRGETIGANGFEFIFFTDYHENSSNNVSPALMKRIQNETSVQNVVYGGDTHDSYGSSALAVAGLRRQYKSIIRPLGKVIAVRGNHDINPFANSNADVISDGAWYDIMLRPIEDIAKMDRLPYYYVENLAQKVRFIILDFGSNMTSPWSSGVQADWLKARLTELSEDWSVVIFIHGFLGITDRSDPGTIYVQATSAKTAIDEVYDQMSATLIGIFCGHIHQDLDLVTSEGYIAIATTCDSAGANGAADHNNPVREPGTTNECAFDVVQIDISARKIYMTRIGAGSDREFDY